MKSGSVQMERGVGNGFLELASTILAGVQRRIVHFLQRFRVLFALLALVLINWHELFLPKSIQSPPFIFYYTIRDPVYFLFFLSQLPAKDFKSFRDIII